MSKHHFIVSLALVSVLMVVSLGLASCDPAAVKKYNASKSNTALTSVNIKNYNSSKSNTAATLNPNEVAKLDTYGLSNLIDEVLAGFSEE